MANETVTPAESDGAEAFESKETADRLPVGWVILAAALIVWGIFYAWAYLPSLGGWSQEGAFQQSVAADAKK
jgi:hypothetical protein